MKLLLVLLVLVSTCGAETWTPPDFCHGLPCPQYKVIQKNPEYEERAYNRSDWIITEIDHDNNLLAFMEARGRLLQVANYTDTWPAVIWVTNEKELSLAWFVGPNSNVKITDSSVTLQERDEMTVFVRPLKGILTISRGQEEKKKFCDMLLQHCSPVQTYAGAGYDSMPSISSYSEIWIIKNT